MLRFALSLRYVMLVGSVAAGIGAVLMFYEAAVKLGGGLRLVFASDQSGGTAVIAAVLGATDACLFGVVLTFFAYAIAFGFVIELDPATREELPRWMRVEGVGELKHTLVEVILVYLVVDFATDVAEGDTHLSWETLVLPTAIALIAGALRLMSGNGTQGSGPHG